LLYRKKTKQLRESDKTRVLDPMGPCHKALLDAGFEVDFHSEDRAVLNPQRSI
jgi:hypothetical protein